MHGAARAHAGDERVGPQRSESQLPPDLGPGRPLVRLGVVHVPELPRQERAGRRRRVAPSPRLMLRGIRLHLRHEMDLGAEAADEVIRSRLIQSGMKMVTGCPSARPMAANGDTGVSARGLGDGVAGFEQASRVPRRERCAAPCGP